MRSPRICSILLAVGLLAGCARTGEVVFVDVASLRVNEATEPMPPMAVANVQPGASGSVPGAKAETRSFDVQRWLRESESERYLERRRELSRLVRLLDGVANEAIDRDQLTGMRALASARSTRATELEKRIRSNFEQFAFDRGPLLTRFSNLDAERFRNPSSVFAKNQTEAKRATQELLNVQLTDYLTGRRRLEGTLSNWYDAELTQFQSEIALRRIKAAEASQTEAEQMLQSGVERARLPETQVLQRRLYAVNESRVEVPSRKIAQAVPAVAIPSPRDSTRESVEIWAATHGYTLTNFRERGRDATKEFKDWLMRRQAGR